MLGIVVVVNAVAVALDTEPVILKIVFGSTTEAVVTAVRLGVLLALLPALV